MLDGAAADQLDTSPAARLARASKTGTIEEHEKEMSVPLLLPFGFPIQPISVWIIVVSRLLRS